MRVRYASRAAADLEGIRQYISKDNPSSAWIVASFLRRSIARLVEWPHSGRATDEPGVRQLTFSHYPYIAYYEVAEEEVVILTVRHTAMER